jgi:N-acetylneuraminic acid mutarotase
MRMRSEMRERWAAIGPAAAFMTVFACLILSFACSAKEEAPEPPEPTNVWTWVSGGQVTWGTGIYATKGSPSSIGVPGARFMSSEWTDASGRLWLFGGEGVDSTGTYGLLNDLWRFDPGTSQWTWISGSEVRDQPGSCGTKGVAAPGNVPGARAFAVSWIDGAGRLWLFGGSGLAATGIYGRLNDLWRFAPDTGLWTWMGGSDATEQPGVYGVRGTGSPSNWPGARDGAVCWRDAAGMSWLFGGSGVGISGYASVLNDLWMFDGSTLEWTWISGDSEPDQLGVYGTKGVADSANVPGARLIPGTWIDPAGRLWLFGGEGWGSDLEGNVYLLNDLWSFDPSTGLWTWFGGSDKVDADGSYGTNGVASPSNVVGARRHPMTWRASDGSFWLFGGDGNGETDWAGFLNDLWKYDPAAGLWTWVGGSKTPGTVGVYGTKGTPAAANLPGARSWSACWLDPQGRFWLFGGGGYGTDPTYNGPLNDLWRYVR